MNGTQTSLPIRHLRRAGLAMLVAVAGVAVGCSSTEPARTQIDDAAISTKVKAKLAADPEVNPFRIDVDTQEGVVRLSGVVDEAKDRREAVKLARETDGVKSVVDDLTVGHKSFGESVDDAVIVTKVKAKITADVDINPFDIDVDSNKGIVTLSGRVDTEAQRDKAGRLARDTEGVRGVENLIKVGDLRK